MANIWYRTTYLKSQDWKNIAGAFRAHFAPDGKCCACGTKPHQKLDVHHLVYGKGLKDGAVPKPTDLIPVCRDCHKVAHHILGNWPDFRRYQYSRVRRILRSLCPKRDQLVDELCEAKKNLESSILEIQPPRKTQRALIKLSVATTRLQRHDDYWRNGHFPKAFDKRETKDNLELADKLWTEVANQILTRRDRECSEFRGKSASPADSVTGASVSIVARHPCTPFSLRQFLPI